MKKLIFIILLLPVTLLAQFRNDFRSEVVTDTTSGIKINGYLKYYSGNLYVGNGVGLNRVILNGGAYTGTNGILDSLTVTGTSTLTGIVGIGGAPVVGRSLYVTGKGQFLDDLYANDYLIVGNDILMSNGDYIGIETAERIEFYTAGYTSVMGSTFGIGTVTPAVPIHTIAQSSDSSNIRLEENSGGEYWDFKVDPSGHLHLLKSGTDGFIFHEDGYLGISQKAKPANPTFMLDIDANNADNMFRMRTNKVTTLVAMQKFIWSQGTGNVANNDALRFEYTFDSNTTAEAITGRLEVVLEDVTHATRSLGYAFKTMENGSITDNMHLYSDGDLNVEGVISNEGLLVSDNTDTFTVKVLSDKLVIQNDAGTPATVFSVDSSGVVEFDTLKADIVLYQDGSEVTLADAGAATITKSYHVFDTFGDAALDTLITITGGAKGMRLYVTTANAGRDILVEHNTDNIRMDGGADVLLDHTDDLLILFCISTGQWRMETFSDTN